MTDKLLESLLYAESESEVDDIIKNSSFLSNSKSWAPLDGRNTNMNTITNQSSSGAKAATELITNMIDAILIKECWKAGIDPKDIHNAPETMYEAVEKFIKKNLQRGKIINAENEWILSYAKENLIIGITSPSNDRNTKFPCFTFVDNGEGQHPKHFTKTFLSLSAKYKSSISFVQGKYNMGSSGTLNYCGENWYKLIVSRRYDKEGNWGWTLIRKSPQSSGDSTFAEYFSPNGKISELSDSYKTIYPFNTRGKKQYQEVSRSAGCIVKLYNYYLGSSYSGFTGVRAALAENMVETILPLRLFDFRVSPGKDHGAERELGIDVRRFCGMEFLLCRQRGNIELDEKEDQNWEPVGLDVITDPKIGEINISAFLFKEEIPQWYKKSNSRVFHHVNGQTMYKETRGFLSRCKFPSLKDRIAIFVDSSALKESISIWKGDRENIQNTPIGEEYKELIKESIKKSDKLKEWEREMSQKELDSAASDMDKNAIRDLLKSDPNLRHLLDWTIPNVPLVGPNPTPPPLYIGKHSPTYINRIDKGNKKQEMNINRGRIFLYETDVVDDYFNRTEHRGEVIFIHNGQEYEEIENKFRVNHTLSSGNLILSLKPDKDRIKIGDEFNFTIGLRDDSMAQDVIAAEDISIKIIQDDGKTPNPNPNPNPNPKPEPSSAGLPHYTILTSDGREISLSSDNQKEEKTRSWESMDFYFTCGSNDGGMIKDLGEKGYMHYINYDNVYFQNSLKGIKEESQVSKLKHKYILGMRIMFLGIENGMKSSKLNNNGKEFNEDYLDEFRRRAAAAASSVVLTLCENIPSYFESTDNDND